MLDAASSGRLKRDQVTAFHIRQLTEAQEFGSRSTCERHLGQNPANSGREADTNRPAGKKSSNEAPLWAYDGRAGREHFQKLCSQCHVLGKEGTRVGPELTGAGKNGIRYFLENIIDPNAVIGTDFQMTTVETRGGESTSGLVVQETPSALTLRTTAGETVIAKADIAQRTASEKSLMPEGSLDSLSEREQIELFKFLTSN